MERIPEGNENRFPGIDSSCLYCLKGIVTDGTSRVYYCSERHKEIWISMNRGMPIESKTEAEYADIREQQEQDSTSLQSVDGRHRENRNQYSRSGY